MKPMDEEMQRRVWDRVRGEGKENDPEITLQTLAVEEKRAGAMYLMLARMMQGRNKLLLRQLAEQSRSHAACLNGMGILEGGKALSTKFNLPAQELPVITLRKCYAHSLRCARFYGSKDGPYAHIFREMAQRSRDQGRMILEILGSLEG